MKLKRILLTIFCLATTAHMYPMNNPTGQKTEHKSQEFVLKTKAGKKAALYALLNPQTLILLAHYKKGYKVNDLAKYTKEKTFLAHLIDLTDVINYHNDILKSKPAQVTPQQIQKPVATAQQQITKKASIQEPIFFEGDIDDFDAILRADSNAPSASPVASDTPSTPSSIEALSPQNPIEPTAMTQQFIDYIQQQEQQQLTTRSTSAPATMIVIKNPNERLATELAHEANMRDFHKAQRTASFSNLQFDRFNAQQLPTIEEQPEPQITVLDQLPYADQTQFFLEGDYKETVRNNPRMLKTPPAETLHTPLTQQKPIALDNNSLRFLQYIKEEQRTLPHSTSAPLLRVHVAPDELTRNLREINRGQFRGFNLEQPLFTQLPSETTEQKENAKIRALKATLASLIGHGTKAAPTPY